MAAHSYSLRSRVSTPSLSVRTPVQSPASRTTKTTRQISSSTSALQLRHVIGTTTSTPSGLSCCVSNNSYAYCAGSVAVYATINDEDEISYRYFKSKPTAVPVHHTTSYHNSHSLPTTPVRSRNSLISRKNIQESASYIPRRDILEDVTSQTWSARERIKAASCVAISPDGRILAVGETGYNPRVLLYATSTSVPNDAPLSIITDHSIGVRSVAFSPNSTYLATLGDLNDGFLYMWQVNTRSGSVKLHSSNKCTTNVCDLTWCGDKIITVGTRHIKIWQALPDSSTPVKRGSRLRRESEIGRPALLPLAGRNCLLGSLADATFTTIVAISDSQAVVCADDGHICLLDLANGKMELSIIEKVDTAVAAISCRLNPLRLIWAGGGYCLEERSVNPDGVYEPSSQPGHSPVDKRKRTDIPRHSLLRQSLGLCLPKPAKIVAFGCLTDKAVSVNAEGSIQILDLTACNLESPVHVAASHSGLVKGVQALPRQAGLGAFFTWSNTGEVRFWNMLGRLLRTQLIDLDENTAIEDATSNELEVVRYSLSMDVLIAGDRLGMIQVLDQPSWHFTHSMRAHGAQVHDITIHESSSLVATCARDRMIQIFKLQNQQLELIQTSDDHISAVNEVLFSHDGKRLLSCSSDRTVVIRERIERKLGQETIFAFVPIKTVTLKATPLSMSLLPSQPKAVAVSTMDRQVIKIDLLLGTNVSSFKVTDRDTDDTVNLNAISVGDFHTLNDSSLLAGYSAIDKSVRLYDMSKGLLVGRDSGHTEGISGIVLFSDDDREGCIPQTTLVSTGLDGTIIIWIVTASGNPSFLSPQDLLRMQSSDSDPEKDQLKNSPASLPPLRKILSKMDIAGFERQVSPTREVSPSGLRRKNSRLALSTSIDEADENVTRSCLRHQHDSSISGETIITSTPAESVTKILKQRSRNNISEGMESRSSGSPEVAKPSLTPTGTTCAARYNTRANNSRLRRPPSVPTDLRAQALTQSRRQSVGITSTSPDFGSIALATEQICRMLKSYRKRLQSCKDELDLDDIEAALEAALKSVKQKKPIFRSQDSEEQDNNEINGLSVLLAKASVS